MDADADTGFDKKKCFKSFYKSKVKKTDVACMVNTKQGQPTLGSL